MKFIASILCAASLFCGLPAAAESHFLSDHPGWQAWGAPGGKLTFTRADRSIAKMSITAFPADDAPITSEEAARSRIDEIVADVVANRPSSCSDLSKVEPSPNGMGFEVVGDQNEPPCRLFISLTPDRRIFANLWLDKSGLPRQSYAYQKTAALWLDLATSRIQGKSILPTADASADLKAIAERVAHDQSPIEMLQMHKTSHPQMHVALPVFEGEPLTNCLNWDPSAYAPRDLRFGGGSGQALLNLGACSIFAWKRDPGTSEIKAFIDGDWRSLQAFSEAIFYDEVGTQTIEPFEPGEQINFLGGDKKRLFNQHRSGDLGDLRPVDAWFTPDGRYTSGGFGLENKPVELRAQSNGRYYLHGHLAVFERDDGPILIALAGKITNNGEIEHLFIGDRSYEMSDEFRQIFSR